MSCEFPGGARPEGTARGPTRPARNPFSPPLSCGYSVMSPQPELDALTSVHPELRPLCPPFISHAHSLCVSWELVTGQRG